MLKPASLALYCGTRAAARCQRRRGAIAPHRGRALHLRGLQLLSARGSQIGRLAQQDGIIALAFHVDYWDSLGWRDRFGLPEAVARQSQYAHTLHLASVYTPQLVIDGQRDLVGGGDGIGASGGNKPGVPLTISVQNGNVVVALGAQQRSGPCDVLLLATCPKRSPR
jgi:hypothetical protein